MVERRNGIYYFSFDFKGSPYDEAWSFLQRYAYTGDKSSCTFFMEYTEAWKLNNMIQKLNACIKDPSQKMLPWHEALGDLQNLHTVVRLLDCQHYSSGSYRADILLLKGHTHMEKAMQALKRVNGLYQLQEQYENQPDCVWLKAQNINFSLMREVITILQRYCKGLRSDFIDRGGDCRIDLSFPDPQNAE